MAIMQIPQVPKPEQKPNIEISDKSFETPIADSRLDNFNELSTYAEGYRWNCDLYLQLVTRDTTSVGFDEELLDINNQFKRIKNFELLLDSELTIEQEDNHAKSFNVTGTAKVYPVVTPNVGDVFVADTGAGKNGIFAIIRVSRPTVYKESFSLIDFRQIRNLDDNINNKLNSKVVEEYHFDRELLRTGVKSLVTTNEVNVTKRLLKAYRRLSNLYLHEFFDTDVKTLTLPKQPVKTYDPYIVSFVLRTFEKIVSPKVGEVLELYHGQNSGGRVLTILDAIEQNDEDLLWSTSNISTTLPISRYKTHPYFRTIAFTGIKAVVNFKDKSFTNDTDEYTNSSSIKITDAGVKRPLDHLIVPGMFDSNLKTKEPFKFIKPVSIDNYYIFSEAFYKDNEDQSILEKLVRRRLRHESIDLTELADLADNADMFDNLSRFYYIPIILALLRMADGVI